MSLFSLSRSAFEAKLAKKLQEHFVNVSRRNRLLARWAFQKTKLPREMRRDYVYDIVKSFVFIPSDTRLITNIVRDLNYRGVPIQKEDVRKQLQKIERKLNMFKLRNFDDEK